MCKEKTTKKVRMSEISENERDKMEMMMMMMMVMIMMTTMMILLCSMQADPRATKIRPAHINRIMYTRPRGRLCSAACG